MSIGCNLTVFAAPKAGPNSIALGSGAWSGRSLVGQKARQENLLQPRQLSDVPQTILIVVGSHDHIHESATIQPSGWFPDSQAAVQDSGHVEDIDGDSFESLAFKILLVIDKII